MLGQLAGFGVNLTSLILPLSQVVPPSSDIARYLDVRIPVESILKYPTQTAPLVASTDTDDIHCGLPAGSLFTITEKGHVTPPSVERCSQTSYSWVDGAGNSGATIYIHPLLGPVERSTSMSGKL